MIIDSTSTSTTGTNFQLLTQCRVRVTSDRVSGWGIREMAKIYSPPHYSEIYYPPHYRPATADPETHCRNAAHQHLEQFTWTVQSSPILSSIPAAAANSGNCTSMQCNGVQTGGVPVQRVTRGWCTVVPYCTLVQSKWCTVVRSWWSGVKCTGPLISEKYCPQIVAALSPTTKQKSPSPPNHHHHHHHCQL